MPWESEKEKELKLFYIPFKEIAAFECGILAKKRRAVTGKGSKSTRSQPLCWANSIVATSHLTFIQGKTGWLWRQWAQHVGRQGLADHRLIKRIVPRKTQKAGECWIHKKIMSFWLPYIKVSPMFFDFFFWAKKNLFYESSMGKIIRYTSRVEFFKMQKILYMCQ